MSCDYTVGSGVSVHLVEVCVFSWQRCESSGGRGVPIQLAVV